MSTLHRLTFVITKDGKTHKHDRQVRPHRETLMQFLIRTYGKGRKLIVSTEKARPGYFCRSYTQYT